GCTMLVFRGDDEGALLVTSVPAASEPIRVSTERTGGWRNLIVRAQGGRDVVMRFDGTSYPADLSRQPQATAEQASAAQPLTLQRVQPPTPPRGAPAEGAHPPAQQPQQVQPTTPRGRAPLAATALRACRPPRDGRAGAGSGRAPALRPTRGSA